MVSTKNLVDKIIDYECGELSDKDTLDLFGYLVKTKQAWTLQGIYGRTAQGLIDSGYLDKEGNILRKV